MREKKINSTELEFNKAVDLFSKMDTLFLIKYQYFVYVIQTT